MEEEEEGWTRLWGSARRQRRFVILRGILRMIVCGVCLTSLRLFEGVWKGVGLAR
jgi:hypothetical protein